MNDKIIGTKNSQKEVDNYIGCINFIIDDLLKHIKRIEIDNEQYFGDCSILGVDRVGILKSVKKLLRKYRKDEFKQVEEYQKL